MQHIEVVIIVASCELVQKLPSNAMKCGWIRLIHSNGKWMPITASCSMNENLFLEIPWAKTQQHLIQFMTLDGWLGSQILTSNTNCTLYCVSLAYHRPVWCGLRLVSQWKDEVVLVISKADTFEKEDSKPTTTWQYCIMCVRTDLMTNSWIMSWFQNYGVWKRK